MALDQITGYLPAATSVVGGVLSLVGGNQAARGSIDAGDATLAASQRAAQAYRDAGARQSASEIIKAKRAKEADDFAASQYLQNAGQAVAAGQRGAAEENRKARLVSSRAIALAAASGAGASDVSVVNLVSRIRGEGAYNAQTQLYQGEDQARRMRMAAAAKTYEGLTAEEAGGLNAGDLTAKFEAAAVSEEAKGEAAQAAGQVNAQTARLRGATGALPGITTALTGLAGLSRYSLPSGDSDHGASLPTDGEVSTANQTSGVEAEVIQQSQAQYVDDYYAAASGVPPVVSVESAGAFNDFQWLSLLD